MRRYLISTLTFLLVVSATNATPFQDNSDAKAVELAEKSMRVMGGRETYDNIRYLRWNFFGARSHIWDKHTGDIRIDGKVVDADGDQIVLMNIHTRDGRAFIDGENVEDNELRDKMLDAGYKAWINDSYWLVMPWKLLDPGVTLRYLGPDLMNDKRLADKVEMTFDNVGVTPENKYVVYFARDSGLIEQWDFYAEASDEQPRFSTPWHIWRMKGPIAMSGDRGEREITDIRVLDELPDGALTSPEPVAFDE